jgi:hypothetical protein
MTRRRPEPTVTECLAFARRALLAPPRKAHIQRPDPVGSVLWRFVLPLAWCPPLNRFGEMNGHQRQALKKQVLARMMVQHGWGRRRLPLDGRPLIRAVRFSSVECDEHNGWTKIAVDRLTGKHGGLNFLVDDKPTRLQLFPWWEPAPPGKGFAYFELWSGG